MKYLVLGGSKGLGAAVVENLKSQSIDVSTLSRAQNCDFTIKENWSKYLQIISEVKPTHILYCAGGGPYGDFQKVKFSSHEWTWRLGFEFPAFVLHEILASQKSWNQIAQICFIGSAIAEAKPDPQAASYSAAKHALLGLISSVQMEKNHLDIRLFSPGYIDTGLLPKNAWPRQKEGLVKSPQYVAEQLMSWLKNPEFINKHQVLE